MALTIQGADIGYDAGEVQTVINNINAKVIKDTIQLMSQGMDTLRTTVDAGWVGTSAEHFKKNMDTDRESISKALEETYEILQGELNNIINKMDEMDANLVNERGE